MSDDSIGLVFGGGGGKGAYHIGVWKALEKHGIAARVKAVSGNSVGSLNAVLFALGDFDLAKRVWLSTGPSDFLTPATGEPGLFSREGLLRIMEKVPLERLDSCGTHVYVTIQPMALTPPEYVRLNGLPSEDKKRLLLATSAIPAVYPPVKTDTGYYVDGCVTEYGNLPIEPIGQSGFEEIYVLGLDQNVQLGSMGSINGRIDVYKRFPKSRFIPIMPLEYLGDPISGTLNFSRKAILSKMQQGFTDADKILSGRRVYYMRNDYTAINTEIRRIMERLFHSGEELQRFINVSCFKLPNLKTDTMGGEINYKNIAEIGGWRVQQHSGLFQIPFHYRILNSRNERVAWFLDPEELLRALEKYECSLLFE